MSQSKFFDPGFGDFIMVDGMVVERRMHAIVEKIKDYDDRLEVLGVDPDTCDFSEAPFVLAEVVQTKDGPQVFKIFEFWELNDSILERIYLADTRRVDVILNMDQANQRVREQSQLRYREKMESKKDLVASIAANNKSSYSFINDNDEKVTIYDDRPSKRESK